MSKDKKKHDKNKKEQKQSVTNQQRVIKPTLDEMRNNFEKYANLYELNDASKKERDREWKVYKKLHKKGLENTNLVELLNITKDECKAQYDVKQSIETRVGLLVALWGVLITALIQSNIPMKNIEVIMNEKYCMNYRLLVLIILAGQVVFGVLSLVFIHKTIKPYNYQMLSLSDKDIFLNGALDDKYVSLVRFTDSYLNSWKNNSKAIMQKGINYSKLIRFISLFTLFVVAGYIVTYGL